MPSGSNARWRIFAAALLFSTGGAAIKACSLSGWQVAGLRSLFACLAFLAFVPAARAWPSRREWLVGCAYSATLVLFVVANKLTTAANTIFLQSTAPLYILLFSPLLLRERIVKRDVVFLLVIALGLALFFVDEARGSVTAPEPLFGNLLALASGVCWAATVMGLRWLGKRGDGASPEKGSGLGAVVTGNALSFLVCAPMIVSGSSGTSSDWLILVYLGVFQIALAYLFLTSALAVVPAFEASVLMMVEPVLNPIWAWVVHGERPGAWAIAGGVIIVVATTIQGAFAPKRE